MENTSCLGAAGVFYIEKKNREATYTLYSTTIVPPEDAGIPDENPHLWLKYKK